MAQRGRRRLRWEECRPHGGSRHLPWRRPQDGQRLRSVALDLPGLPVDTHVGRLAHRLDLTQETDPVKAELPVNAMVPAEERGGFSLRLILHGRAVCIGPQSAVRGLPAGGLLSVGVCCRDWHANVTATGAGPRLNRPIQSVCCRAPAAQAATRHRDPLPEAARRRPRPKAEGASPC